eukprot:TRINITY_DN25282_c0_g1_i1.p1 TRINITY_DN25282_c0_g1~~TRINITY_DN25282_c0_g1_i1.p1  ORF type:complete len:349 (-),score=55.59 TRINITY_DN25282_c0_g1_i1:40-1086(-)
MYQSFLDVLLTQGVREAITSLIGPKQWFYYAAVCRAFRRAHIGSWGSQSHLTSFEAGCASPGRLQLLLESQEWSPADLEALSEVVGKAGCKATMRFAAAHLDAVRVYYGAAAAGRFHLLEDVLPDRQGLELAIALGQIEDYNASDGLTAWAARWYEGAAHGIAGITHLGMYESAVRWCQADEESKDVMFNNWLRTQSSEVAKRLWHWIVDTRREYTAYECFMSGVDVNRVDVLDYTLSKRGRCTRTDRMHDEEILETILMAVGEDGFVAGAWWVFHNDMTPWDDSSCAALREFVGNHVASTYLAWLAEHRPRSMEYRMLAAGMVMPGGRVESAIKHFGPVAVGLHIEL